MGRLNEGDGGFRTSCPTITRVKRRRLEASTPWPPVGRDHRDPPDPCHGIRRPPRRAAGAGTCWRCGRTKRCSSAMAGRASARQPLRDARIQGRGRDPPRLKVPFKGPKSGPKPTRTGKLMAPSTSGSSVRPLIVSAAPPAVPKSFVGLSDSDNNPTVEPPDPWVAVNGTDVIQIVNSIVRVSTEPARRWRHCRRGPVLPPQRPDRHGRTHHLGRVPRSVGRHPDQL